MKIVASFLAFSFVATLASAQTESQIRERIAGTWKLVSAEYTMKDGSKRPYGDLGPHGKGFLMYAADGYMCADLVNPDRPKWADVVHPTLQEKAAVAEGSFAYCGRYEINTAKKQIVHLPEVSSRPDYTGSSPGPPVCLRRWAAGLE